MKKIAERRAQLLNRLAELDERLHDIENEFDTHQSKDWEEMATEREDEEVLEGLGLRGAGGNHPHSRRAQTDARWEYGACTVCGDEISEARLDVVPDTPFCKSCAAKL